VPAPVRPPNSNCHLLRLVLSLFLSLSFRAICLLNRLSSRTNIPGREIPLSGRPSAAFLFCGVPEPSKVNSVRLKRGSTAKSGKTLVHCKLFRINTYKSVSKQTTLTFFRMNTCEKPGGGGIIVNQTRGPAIYRRKPASTGSHCSLFTTHYPLLTFLSVR
jgi:hypothetical protein